MRWDLAVNEGVCRRALAACSALCISAESEESKQEVSAAQRQALPSLSHPTLVNHCSHLLCRALGAALGQAVPGRAQPAHGSGAFCPGQHSLEGKS